jgi:rubrerythrin
MKKFDTLSEREVLALAISLEEEDERLYADFAEGLRQDYPASAAVFEGMRKEESRHRRRSGKGRLTIRASMAAGPAGADCGSEN